MHWRNWEPVCEHLAEVSTAFLDLSNCRASVHVERETPFKLLSNGGFLVPAEMAPFPKIRTNRGKVESREEPYFCVSQLENVGSIADNLCPSPLF